MSGKKEVPGPTKPRQPRSQKTLEKILAATEELLQERDFEEITMDEIAAEAGVAVGTLYTRFSNKHDLLPYLISRVQDEQLRIAPEMVNALHWKDKSLEARVTHQIKGSALQMNSEKKGLYKAIAKRTLTEADRVPDTEIEKTQKLQDILASWLLQCRDEIEHPDPELAVKMAVFLMVSPLQIKLFFLKDRTESLDKEKFSEELIRVVMSYLKPGRF